MKENHYSKDFMSVVGEICNTPLFLAVINLYLDNQECMMKCVLREHPRRRVFLVPRQIRRLLWNMNCHNSIYKSKSTPRTLSQILTLWCATPSWLSSTAVSIFAAAILETLCVIRWLDGHRALAVRNPR